MAHGPNFRHVKDALGYKNPRPSYIARAIKAYIFSNNSRENDVGVVILKKKVSDRNFKPICLPRAKVNPIHEDNFIVGWGYEFQTGLYC